jgi:hypothetical protein
MCPKGIAQVALEPRADMRARLSRRQSRGVITDVESHGSMGAHLSWWQSGVPLRAWAT